MMDWQHFEPWQTGLACIITDEAVTDCPYEVGEITTGKQRVFHRYYIKVRLPDGATVTGQDAYRVRDTLLSLDQQLRAKKLVLLAAGVEPGFFESGLSFNTGYGYLRNLDHSIHMMDVPPPRQCDPEHDKIVEGLIREAVAGMFRGNSGAVRAA